MARFSAARIARGLVRAGAVLWPVLAGGATGASGRILDLSADANTDWVEAGRKEELWPHLGDAVKDQAATVLDLRSIRPRTERIKMRSKFNPTVGRQELPLIHENLQKYGFLKLNNAAKSVT